MQTILNHRNRVLRITAIFPLVAFAASARADIFQWEYINPADPNLGKQRNTILAPDGAGVDAVPGADLSYRDLTMAYLSGEDLTGAYAHSANLTDATLSWANLAKAKFFGATLTGADFSDAVVSGADLSIYNDPISFKVAESSSAVSHLNFGTGISLEQLYSTASYKTHDLRGIGLRLSAFDGGNLVGQDLTNADFIGASLSGVDFTGAQVRGAQFSTYRSNTLPVAGTGVSLEQLYSTASYEARDLSGIGLRDNNLSGGNFAKQNLAKGDFGGAYLIGADLHQADLANANFYIADLTGADFSQAKLNDAFIGGASLTGADLTGAEISGANFDPFVSCNDLCYSFGPGITLAQLYSTASYQAGDLAGVALPYHNLNSANFVGQNLTNASFYGAKLNSADLTAADIRGAQFVGAELGGAVVTNLIGRDGHIDDLDLVAGGVVVIRDYDGDPKSLLPPIPITVDQHLAMSPGSTLRVVFEADAWDSTVSFAPGIPVTLGGTLELSFADDVDLASQVGRSFHVFDWTGVSPSGAFTISSPYTWDLSDLYTTGGVTLTAIPEPCCLALAVVGAFSFPLNRRRNNP